MFADEEMTNPYGAATAKKVGFFGAEEASPIEMARSPSLFDSSKEPEEEYFRLSCLALKIIYNDHD